MRVVIAFSFVIVMIFSSSVLNNVSFAEPLLEITDCKQSQHQLRYKIYAYGFIPDTRILLQEYKPDSERPEGWSSMTDSEGNWKFEEAGYTSSLGVTNGTTRFEAYNVNENFQILPNSPYAEAELITPCKWVTDPPDTEVFATVNEKSIPTGGYISANFIQFYYQITNHFAPFAQFECKLDDSPFENCTIERCENPGSCNANWLENGEREYEDLSPGEHLFVVRATDDAGNTDPTPANFIWNIVRPTAQSGQDQIVHSKDKVMLNGSNSSDVDNSHLTYSWSQIQGPVVHLSDPLSANPTFTAPDAAKEIRLVFELTVRNEYGISSEPDGVTIFVKPIPISAPPPPTEEPNPQPNPPPPTEEPNPQPNPPPPTEEPRTLDDMIGDLLRNQLNMTNSIESVNEIVELLTDNDLGNDKLACNLLGQLSKEQIKNIQDILQC
jgi:hypothetical protein